MSAARLPEFYEEVEVGKEATLVGWLRYLSTFPAPLHDTVMTAVSAKTVSDQSEILL